MKQYIKAKQRIIKISGKKDISDFEIIERLENEIDYYRNKVELLEKVKEEQREYILKNQISDNNDELDNEIKEITTSNIYADGKVIETIIQYRYNEETKQSTCPKIEIGMHPSG